MLAIMSCKRKEFEIYMHVFEWNCLSITNGTVMFSIKDVLYAIVCRKYVHSCYVVYDRSFCCISTANPVENCDGQPLQQIALAILSCFCTDPELVSRPDSEICKETLCDLISLQKVLHPQITSKIPIFNEFISSV